MRNKNETSKTPHRYESTWDYTDNRRFDDRDRDSYQTRGQDREGFSKDRDFEGFSGGRYGSYDERSFRNRDDFNSYEREEGLRGAPYDRRGKTSYDRDMRDQQERSDRSRRR